MTNVASGRLLLLVNAHYAPDVASTGQHLTDLAEYLAARGVPVEVIAGRAAYEGGKASASGCEVRAGVRVRRIGLPTSGRGSVFLRLVAYLVLLAGVCWIVCLERDVDGIILLTTPPLLPVAGWLARRLRGRRYGIWSMDLHPEAEVAAMMLRPRGWLTRALQSAANASYRHADFVVVLGPYMAARVRARGVAEHWLATVSIWAPGGSGDATDTDRDRLRRRLGVEERFVVMYAGNAGLVHDFGPILGAMQLLRHHPAVFFLFVGGGPRRREIEAFVERHGISNFAYHDYVPRAELAALLRAADVHVITLRPEFAGIAVPGKAYSAMASARPVLFVGPQQSEIGEAVRTSECGIVVDCANGTSAHGAEQIAAHVDAWYQDPARAGSLGARGHAAYGVRYSREANCAAFERVMCHAWPRICPGTA